MTNDERREARIKDYTARMIEATSGPARLFYWRLMKDEIRHRSPQQVARMAANA
jgi:hypothetical protein